MRPSRGHQAGQRVVPSAPDANPEADRSPGRRPPFRIRGADVTEDGIDLSMLRENLTFTPAERVRNMLGTVRLIERLELGKARP